MEGNGRLQQHRGVLDMQFIRTCYEYTSAGQYSSRTRSTHREAIVKRLRKSEKVLLICSIFFFEAETTRKVQNHPTSSICTVAVDAAW